MNEALFIDYTLQALILVLILSLPPVVIAAGTGLLVSLLQALTQVQEQTISFTVKLVAVIITLIVTARWVGAELYMFTLKLFDSFPVNLS